MSQNLTETNEQKKIDAFTNEFVPYANSLFDELSFVQNTYTIECSPEMSFQDDDHNIIATALVSLHRDQKTEYTMLTGGGLYIAGFEELKQPDSWYVLELRKSITIYPKDTIKKVQHKARKLADDMLAEFKTTEPIH